MWAAIQNPRLNIPVLKEFVREWVQMTTQKTAGQRGGKDLSWDNLERVKIGILCEAVALVQSRELDRLEAEAPTLTPPNEPLTPEQLREMDGEPAWNSSIRRWGIVKVDKDGTVFLLTKSGEFGVDPYGRTKIYRRAPEGKINE